MTNQSLWGQSLIPAGMETKALISLMTSAYTQGLKAGHVSAQMKDNQEFADDAARLFASGLNDMLTGVASMQAQ